MKKFLLFSAAILTMLAASCKNDGKEDQKDPNQVQEAPQAPGPGPHRHRRVLREEELKRGGEVRHRGRTLPAYPHLAD